MLTRAWEFATTRMQQALNRVSVAQSPDDAVAAATKTRGDLNAPVRCAITVDDYKPWAVLCVDDAAKALRVTVVIEAQTDGQDAYVRVVGALHDAHRLYAPTKGRAE